MVLFFFLLREPKSGNILRMNSRHACKRHLNTKTTLLSFAIGGFCGASNFVWGHLKGCSMFAFAPHVLCPQVLQVGRNECRHEAAGLRDRMVASAPFFSLRSCRRQVLKRTDLLSLNRREVCLLRGGVKVSFVLADALSLVRRFPRDLYCDFRCGRCSRSRLCAVAESPRTK